MTSCLIFENEKPLLNIYPTCHTNIKLTLESANFNTFFSQENYDNENKSNLTWNRGFM